MRRQIVPAIIMMVVFILLLGFVYPLVVTGVAQVAFHDKANGSLVKVNGKVVGSKLIGQEFTAAKYFHGRPSAAGALASGSKVDGKSVDPSDISQSASSGSNLGPTNSTYLKTVRERVAGYRKENSLPASTAVPVDAVTASGSGLDPSISVANANIQAARVARVRGLPLKVVLAAVKKNTTGQALGFLGERAVNVLTLNVALDRTASRRS